MPWPESVILALLAPKCVTEPSHWNVAFPWRLSVSQSAGLELPSSKPPFRSIPENGVDVEVGVAVWVAVGVIVDVEVRVDVGVAVGVGVRVDVGVAVGVIVCVGPSGGTDAEFDNTNGK